MANLDEPADSIQRLVSARQVQGTAVFNTALEELGTIDDMVIDRANGRIAFAVLAMGGFLGIGEHHYPLPREKLRFDPEMGGYIVDIDRETLLAGPSYTDRNSAAWNDEAWTHNIYTHYGVHETGDPSS